MRKIKPLKRLFVHGLLFSVVSTLSGARSGAEPLKSSSGPRTAIHSLGNSLETRREDSHSQFLVGLELGQITLPTSSLMGVGARLGWEYGFSERLSFLPSLGMVTGVITASGYLYTGINAMLRYSFIGSATRHQRELLYNGAPIVTQTQSQQSRLSVSLGLEQLILSGFQSAYMAVGPALGVNYNLRVFSQVMEVSLRAATLTGNNRAITALFLNLSFAPGN